MNLVNNYKLMVSGPDGFAGAPFDLEGFAMSFSGVPGFDIDQVRKLMYGNVRGGYGGRMGAGANMYGANVPMQSAMTIMRAVGARAGMGGLRPAGM